MPLVSVIIPCYNLGEFVAETVHSALAQKGCDVEVVLIDDGSTDPNTIRKLDELDTEPAVVFMRTGNRGVAAARNAGIDIAQGEFLLFLDADDRLLPGALAKMIEVLNAHPEAVLAYPAFRRMDTGEAVHRPQWNRFALLYTNTLSNASLVRKDRLGFALYRDTARGFEYEDWDFWLQLTEQSPAVHVPEVLFEYRVRPSSRGKEGNRHHAEIIDDLQYLNGAAYAQVSLMETKKQFAPAVSIFPNTKEAFRDWRDLLQHDPFLDAQLVDPHQMAEPGGVTILGKYLLHDPGRMQPDAEAFLRLLKTLEETRALPAMPAGWRLSFPAGIELQLDSTVLLARRYADATSLDELSTLQEKLWRYSCPAWTKKRFPQKAEELGGETARAKFVSQRLAAAQLMPYAVFGAGQHTQRLLQHNTFAPPPAMIFDDAPAADSLGGIPVRAPDAEAKIKAVVVSSDAYERQLHRRALAMFGERLPILRLYS